MSKCFRDGAIAAARRRLSSAGRELPANGFRVEAAPDPRNGDEPGRLPFRARDSGTIHAGARKRADARDPRAPRLAGGGGGGGTTSLKQCGSAARRRSALRPPTTTAEGKRRTDGAPKPSRAVANQAGPEPDLGAEGAVQRAVTGWQHKSVDAVYRRFSRPSAPSSIVLVSSRSLRRLLHAHLTSEQQDLHSDNLLIAITDDSVLSTLEENEIHKPSARKLIGDTIIYVSQYMLGGAGPLTICDLGQARTGSEHRGNAMPVPYRAPEVILSMTWGNAVDTWSVGLLAWDLLERESLFRVYDHESEERNDAHHLAAMTALLGPPPPEFLRRSKETSRYWNEDGQWHGPVPLPPEKDFESLTNTLAGEDKDMFLNFVQCVLSWLPEERLTTLQAYFHPWLRGERC